MAIEEFPTISIDDFQLKPNKVTPELCFLTHMHEDHTRGLARKSYYGPVIYCSKATRALLLNFRTKSGRGELKYNHLRREVCGKEIVNVLEFDRPYGFELRDKSKIQVTLIDANHCPGAAMVLIQRESNCGGSVLFTGDVRCEKWHLDALNHNPCLFPYIKNLGGREDLSLYVDDTFMLHGNPYRDYVDNYSGINTLANLLATYPSEVHFCMSDKVTGFEEVLISLAQKLDTLVHMDMYHYNLYQLAADSSPLAQKLLEVSTLTLPTQGNDTSHLKDTSQDFGHNKLIAMQKKPVRLHFCLTNTACPMREPHAPMAYFKACNQPTQNQVDLQNAQHYSNLIPPGIMIPFEENPQVCKGPDQRYFLDQKTCKYYPLFPWFYFSRHASFPEIAQLADMFNKCSIKSLSGEKVACIMPTANNNNNREHFLVQTKRVKSLIEGEIASTENLPILAKKPKMLQMHQRDALKKRRDRNKKASMEIVAESQNSTANTDDEENRHSAMMLLGQHNARTHVINSICENVNRVSNVNYDKENHYDSQRKKESEAKFFSDEQCSASSSLPSPPISPSEHNSSCNESRCNGVIDETIDDTPQENFNSLVEKLRQNPEYWFSLTLECISTR